MLSKCKSWMRTYLYQFYYDYDYKSQNVDRVKIIVLYITTERHNGEVFDTYCSTPLQF
jgi:hypothetical protein